MTYADTATVCCLAIVSHTADHSFSNASPAKMHIGGFAQQHGQLVHVLHQPLHRQRFIASDEDGTVSNLVGRIVKEWLAARQKGE